ncbi:hypothetical protein CTEN210_09780 [Chaetoceros tenuissimus]|uniref:F-box domain-containing protein n=1 Tax=Chaetoceros tenuissimus TaxID=426638 RepID=A0AAD3CWS4_9STRA|nr:hypothetical protein CTEN210_09780 [Chaetoceros tenuissimus]
MPQSDNSRNDMNEWKRMRLEHEVNIPTEALKPSAGIQDIPLEVLKNIFTYVGIGNYFPIGYVSKDFSYNYLAMNIVHDAYRHPMDYLLAARRNMITYPDGVSSSIDLAEYCFLHAPEGFQLEVCFNAASKGRLDIVKLAKVFDVYPENDHELNELLNELTSKFIDKNNDDLEALKEYFIEYCMNNESQRNVFVSSAAHNGNLYILKWIHASYDISSEAPDVCSGAITGGHLEIIEWGLDTFKLDFEKQNYVNEALRAGDLEIVKWFRNRNASWNQDSFLSAVKSRNIALLDWLWEQGCPLYDHNYCNAAVDWNPRYYNNEKALEVLQWLHQHDFRWDESTCMIAAAVGNIDALLYARTNGCDWDSQTLETAVEHVRFDIVKYCLQNNCPQGHSVFDLLHMAYDESLAMLKLLVASSVPWDARTCNRVARSGKLEAFKFCLSQGCRIDNSTMKNVIQSENMALIQYCLDNNYPFYVEDYEEAVACEDPIPLLKLFQEYGYELNERTCALAARYGDIQLLRWLKYKGYPWDEETCIQAVLFNCYEALVYAHGNGCVWTKRTFAMCFDLENGLGLAGTYVQIPTQHECSDEIFNYILEQNCPQPDPSDWQILPTLNDRAN